MSVENKGRFRLGAFLFFGVLGLVAAAIYGQVTTDFSAVGNERVLLFVWMGVSMFGVAFFWPGFRNNRTEIWVLMSLALMMRLAIFPTAPSDDLYRYIWEGQLVATGVSPYTDTADSEFYEDYRGELWEKMNHKERLTAYPPLAQYGFAIIAGISESPFFFNGVFLVFDLAVFAVLLLILRGRSLPLRWAIFYGLNPVVLAAFAAEGHFDVWLVLALVCAVFFSDHRRPLLTGLFLGLAVQIKIIAIVAFPFLLRRLGWRGTALGVSVVALLCVPFKDDLSGLVMGVLGFGVGGDFNGVVHFWILRWTENRTLANLVIFGAFGLLCAWRFFGRSRDTWSDDLFWLMGGLIVLSPIQHFWYITWILPLVALKPSLAWLVFTVTQAIYFRVWERAENGVWGLTIPEIMMMNLPFIVIGLYELRSLFVRKAAVVDESQDGVSVVIPTLNAAESLETTLRSLRFPENGVDEVIVADGGSTDKTSEIAKKFGTKWVESEPGRGNQTAAGLEQASFRIIVILHADCSLIPGSIDRIQSTLNADPGVVGGCLGQRFDEDGVITLLVEALNEARATMGGVGFGDQVQFFDRSRLSAAEFPAQPLMEDVEFSLRMIVRGKMIYLGKEVWSSAEKWRKGRSFKRIFLVMSLVTRYRLKRIFGKQKAADFSKKLYREYYRAN